MSNVSEALPLVSGLEYGFRMQVTANEAVFPQGCKVQADVRQYLGDPDEVAVLTFENGSLIRVNDSTIDVRIPESATAEVWNNQVFIDFTRLDLTPDVSLYTKVRIPAVQPGDRFEMLFSSPVVVASAPGVSVTVSRLPSGNLPPLGDEIRPERLTVSISLRAPLVSNEYGVSVPRVSVMIALQTPTAQAELVATYPAALISPIQPLAPSALRMDPDVQNILFPALVTAMSLSPPAVAPETIELVAPRIFIDLGVRSPVVQPQPVEATPPNLVVGVAMIAPVVQPQTYSLTAPAMAVNVVLSPPVVATFRPDGQADFSDPEASGLILMFQDF